MVLTRSPYLFMAIVKCLEPIKNPWLLSSICCLFPCQMTFLCMSSCTTHANTSPSVRVSWGTCLHADLALAPQIRCVSPDRHRRFRSCSSRAPNQSGSPRPSLRPPAEGSTGGRGGGLPSAGRGRGALQEDQSETARRTSRPLVWCSCSSSKPFLCKRFCAHLLWNYCISAI